MPARKGSQKEDRWRITEMNSISDADLAQTPRQTPMKWALLAIVLLALSNVGLAVAAGIAWGRLEDQQSSAAPTAENAYCAPPSTNLLSRAVFSAQHSLPGSAPLLVPATNISTAHLQRSHTFYSTIEANYTVASGVTKIVLDNKTIYEVHIELLNNTNFGEYAGGDGAVGNRAFQLRIVDAVTQAELVLVPLSFSLVKSKATLVPNTFFFSYRPAPVAGDCCL